MPFAKRGQAASHGVDTHLPNPFVRENTFLSLAPELKALPPKEAFLRKLPRPFWEGHADAMACYWKAWELAHANLRQPATGSGFVSNFIDTAFNNCLFMWDSALILLFGRYGARAFNFQKTLDNFYAHQHADGYICRELREKDGAEIFERFDPASTGPNIMPWSEWEYFLNTGDRGRLARVFPPLVAYYQWTRAYRTWPDGTYWSSGWGCGMDNQPRGSGKTQFPYNKARLFNNFNHGHFSWIDTTLQQITMSRILGDMARVLGRQKEIRDIREEGKALARFVNSKMWDARSAFYCDREPDGRLTRVKSVAGFWALLSGIVPPARLGKFIAHLSNAKEFNRPHCVPSLSADHSQYDPAGGYWLGSVWPPTNYMVLRGLTLSGQDALAHKIACNHLSNVVDVFKSTGTVWENYAPDKPAPGNQAKKDFVGWSGIPPVAVLFEYVFGLRPNVPRNELLWDVRLLEEHGVQDYPFGPDGLLTLRCKARKSEAEKPVIEVTSNTALKLRVKWKGGSMVIRCKGL